MLLIYSNKKYTYNHLNNIEPSCFALLFSAGFFKNANIRTTTTTFLRMKVRRHVLVKHEDRQQNLICVDTVLSTSFDLVLKKRFVFNN